MAKTPGVAEDKLNKVINSWQDLRKDKPYAGMTIEEFKARIGSSFTIRTEINTMETQLKSKKDQRDVIDSDNLDIMERVVNSMIAEEGRDSDLYHALGYVRKSERATGLTHKKKVVEPAKS